MKNSAIGVLDRHDELTGDGRPTGRIVVILGETDKAGNPMQPIEEGARYVIGAHPGTEATLMGYKVNQIIGPRMLQIQKGFTGGAMNAETANEITELEKTDPEAAKARLAEVGQSMQDGDFAEVTEVLATAWRELDPVKEYHLVRELLKYTSCPIGHLNSSTNFDKWFQRDRLAHLKPLRDEVVEYNRFLDMMDGLF